jgi:putative sterol carrier protein
MEALNKWVGKVEEPGINEKFVDFNKTLQFVFTNEDYHLMMVFQDQTCTLQEGEAENPEIVITTTSDTILGITNGKIKPVLAFMSGKIKTKGSMPDMLKVQTLMKQ